MSNPLCTSEECKTSFGCAHRGPHGQMCWFDHEKALAELVGVEWEQRLTFAQLLTMVQGKLDALPNPVEHSNLLNKIANQMRPRVVGESE